MKKRNYIEMATDLIIPILLLIGITILFRSNKWDLAIQSKFWHPSDGWFLKNSFPWKQLYHYGNIPALIVVLGALIVLAKSFFKEKTAKYQKMAGFLVLVMLLGPGIIVNSVLKQHWGRPRPREVVEFGGHSKFERVCDYDKMSGGNSFPCGHATMGFFFFAPALLFRRKKLKFYGILLFAWIYGLAIGMARIIQGGHFTSDVLWAAMIVYWVSYLLYYLMGLDKSLYTEKVCVQRLKKSKTVVALTVVISIVLIALVLTATPYTRVKRYDRFKEFDSKFSSSFDISLLNADVKIEFAENFLYKMSAHGFGFPGSKLINKYDSSWNQGLQKHDWYQTKKGFFSELRQEGELVLPLAEECLYSIKIDEGNVDLTLSENMKSLKLEVIAENGFVIINKPKDINIHFKEDDKQFSSKEEGIVLSIKTKNPVKVLEY